MIRLASTVCPAGKIEDLRRIDAGQPEYCTGFVREFIIPGGADGFDVVHIDTRHDAQLREVGLLVG